MKRLLGGALLALLGGISGGAWAQTASPVDWSGFYAGGLLGATNGNSELSSVTGRLQYFDNTDARQIARVGNNKLDQWGAAGGLLAGYNRQFGNVLLGVEGSVNSLSVNKESVRNEELETIPGTQMVIRQSVSADWMAGLRVRLGWAESNWLAYLTGGIAATQLKLEATYTDNAWSGYSRGAKSASVTGTSLGFGGEYALGRNWSLRGEYLYTKFGEISTVSDVTSTNNSGGTMIHKANLDIQSFLIGLTYRFN